MGEKRKENAAVISQEKLAEGIYSMWIRTEASKSAKPGQFISVYTNDGSKLLPSARSTRKRGSCGSYTG